MKNQKLVSQAHARGNLWRRLGLLTLYAVEDDLSRKGTAGNGQTQASGGKRREGGEAEEINSSLWSISRG